MTGPGRGRDGTHPNEAPRVSDADSATDGGDGHAGASAGAVRAADAEPIRDGDTVRLSTGQRVKLPLETEARVVAAGFPADRGAVRAALPEGLVPIRATPTKAAVAVVSVAYDRIGRRGQIDPYDELVVLLPCVPTGSKPLAAVPYASLVRYGIGGYVEALPVTSSVGRALGREVWGFPKTVAEVTHEEREGGRRTTVRRDGQRVLAVSVDRPPTVDWRVATTGYSRRDGELLRERLSLAGSVGGAPRGSASVSFGEHPRGRELAELDVGETPLVRLAATATFSIGAGRPV